MGKTKEKDDDKDDNQAAGGESVGGLRGILSSARSLGWGKRKGGGGGEDDQASEHRMVKYPYAPLL